MLTIHLPPPPRNPNCRQDVDHHRTVSQAPHILSSTARSPFLSQKPQALSLKLGQKKKTKHARKHTQKKQSIYKYNPPTAHTTSTVVPVDPRHLPSAIARRNSLSLSHTHTVLGTHHPKKTHRKSGKSRKSTPHNRRSRKSNQEYHARSAALIGRNAHNILPLRYSDPVMMCTHARRSHRIASHLLPSLGTYLPT